MKISVMYALYVHGISANVDADDCPAMRLCQMAEDREAIGRSYIEVDLSDGRIRAELLSGAEAYSAGPYPNKKWSNEISQEAQRIFNAIHEWERVRD